MIVSVRFLLASWLCAGVVLTGEPAAARERLAVFVGVEGDPALSENLTEVAIAELAESGEYELVGSHELELGGRDVTTMQKEGLARCVALPACLAELGERAGTTRAVIGNVRTGEAGYDLELALVHTRTFTTERRGSRRVPPELSALIDAVQGTAVELTRLESPVETPPSAPVLSAAPQQNASAPPSSEVLGLSAPPAAERKVPPPIDDSTSWRTIVGFSAVGLAVVAFSAAAVTGISATSPPSGTTRKQRQDDIEHKENQAQTANLLLAGGAALSVVAVVSFAWP